MRTESSSPVHSCFWPSRWVRASLKYILALVRNIRSVIGGGLSIITRSDPASDPSDATLDFEIRQSQATRGLRQLPPVPRRDACVKEILLLCQADYN
jgi:hypothetical protein